MGRQRRRRYTHEYRFAPLSDPFTYSDKRRRFQRFRLGIECTRSSILGPRREAEPSQGRSGRPSGIAASSALSPSNVALQPNDLADHDAATGTILAAHLTTPPCRGRPRGRGSLVPTHIRDRRATWNDGD